jgi:cellulose synthase (UDP-forming)
MALPVLYRPGVARTIAVAAGTYLLYYFWWRLTATLNPEALAFSIVLLAAEAQGLINAFLFGFMTWDPARRAPFRLVPGLRVDVYVPTYNEPLSILEATLVGCQAITYPHTTYVLDDGRRAEVAALAARLGCQYLTRPDNRHAKAGNLNAALPRTSGDFIAILDADTVPQPNFLDRTLGYFADERVALVQLPQEFFNLDSVQHRPGASSGGAGAGAAVWHEQSLFYRLIQPAKNRWNAAFWCGSPSVIRRAALESVGGVAVETITEDIHTSIRLHARGWKTVYHNEVLAYGIAPQTLHAFAVQRLRWAQGAMQLLRSRENPLWIRGLTLAQRLNYFASMATYFDAYQKLIYLLAPVAILLTGVLPLRVEAWDFLAHWLPYFCLGQLANVALGRGHFRYLAVEQYNLLKMFTFLWASTALFWPRPLRFRVTPKETSEGVRALERRLLAPHLAALAVVGLAVALGMAGVLRELASTGRSRDVVVVTVFWAIWNATLLLLGVHDVLRRRYHRREFRMPIRIPALVADGGGWSAAATAEDLTRQGASVRLPGPLPLSHYLPQREASPVGITLLLPDGPLAVEGDVVHHTPAPDGQWRLGIQFRPVGAQTRHRLVYYLFVTVPGYGRTRAGAGDGARAPARAGCGNGRRRTGAGGPAVAVSRARTRGGSGEWREPSSGGRVASVPPDHIPTGEEVLAAGGPLSQWERARVRAPSSLPAISSLSLWVRVRAPTHGEPGDTLVRQGLRSP